MQLYWMYWWTVVVLVASCGFIIYCILSSIKTDSFSFQFWYLLSYSYLIVGLGLPTPCWIKMVRVGSLILLLVSKEKILALHHWVWCYLWACHIWPLWCWGKFPLYPLCWKDCTIQAGLSLSSVFHCTGRLQLAFSFSPYRQASILTRSPPSAWTIQAGPFFWLGAFPRFCTIQASSLPCIFLAPCSRSLMMSCHTFKPLSHFEFIFVHGVRVCFSFIDWHVSLQFSSNYLLKRLTFYNFIFFSALSKINWL